MHIATILVMAVALSLDAFAVSIASGIIIKRQKFVNAVRLGAIFCAFQMIMPVVGWLGGRGFYRFIRGVDHWLAFCLLLFIGVKMIYEAVKFRDLENVSRYLSIPVLLGLGLATSMDALAVGLSLSFVNVSIVMPVILTGIVTFGMSYAGFFMGARYGHIFEKKVEIVAGLLLIGIGINILLQYLRT